MLKANWSEVLKTDLDKLSQLSTPSVKPAAPKLKEGERRTVTILFLDIQGFTAMSEKLDPEDVQLIIDNCFKILTNEIEKFHGYIDKYEGDRMMALFGSRQASEVDCERALRAGLGMKQKFGDINRILAERDIRIGIRIGINTGLVVTGRIGKGRDQDFTVMGDAVNLASRLETNAPAGEILVSEDVVRATGDVFVFESLGRIEVKGKSDLIPVFVVKGLNPSRAERWERSPFTKRSQYVPRREQEQLTTVANEVVQAGRGLRTVSLYAPAGIGKSRLVHEFAKLYRTPQGRQPIIVKAAAPADQTVPFALFSNLLRNVLTAPTGGATFFQDVPEKSKEIADRLEPVAYYLAGLREADPRMAALEPQALQLEIHLTIRFVLERLAEMAAERRVGFLLVLFEDLQWVDSASLEALQFLGANLLSDAPMVFVWTSRPEFRPSEEMKKMFQIEETELRPLGQDECRAILRNVLGTTQLNPKDEELLVGKSGGNPFFMEELIQSLVDDGTLSRSGDTWELSRPIEEATLPESVNRILLTRIDKLELELKEMLMAAAVVGETVPLRVLQDVVGVLGAEKNSYSKRIDQLVELGFTYRKEAPGAWGPEIAFRHALTRDVVYSMLLNHNKKVLHEMVGRTLEKAFRDRLDDQASLLFYHFRSAGLAAEAIRYGLSYMDYLLRHYTMREAQNLIRTLRPLLSEGASEEERFRAEVRLTEAEIRLNDFSGMREDQLKGVQALSAMAQSKPTPELEARVALHRANYLSAIGDFNQMKEQASLGLQKLGPDSPAKRLRMDLLRVRGISEYSTGSYKEALQLYQQGLELARELKDRNAEGTLYNHIGLIHFNMSQPDDALRHYIKARDIMTEIGDRRGEGTALVSQGLVHWTLGEYSRAFEEMSRSHEIFKEIGFKKAQAVTLGNIGLSYHKFGKYNEAIACYERALKLRREIKDRAGEGYDLVNIGVVYRHQGNFPKALEFFEAGQWLAREVGSKYLLAANLNCLAIVYRKMGETEHALLERAVAYGMEALEIANQSNLIPAKIKALSNLGRAHFLMGNRDKACQLSQEAFDLLEQHKTGAEGVEEDTYVNHYTLLSETDRKEEAMKVLEELVALIRDRADRIREPEFRESFLKEVRQNRFALEEWEKTHR